MVVGQSTLKSRLRARTTRMVCRAGPQLLNRFDTSSSLTRTRDGSIAAQKTAQTSHSSIEYPQGTSRQLLEKSLKARRHHDP
jgi:hypothetical protein